MATATAAAHVYCEKAWRGGGAIPLAIAHRHRPVGLSAVIDHRCLAATSQQRIPFSFSVLSKRTTVSFALSCDLRGVDDSDELSVVVCD